MDTHQYPKKHPKVKDGLVFQFLKKLDKKERNCGRRRVGEERYNVPDSKNKSLKKEL